MTGDFKIMLTKKQKDLLMFIHEKIRETGVSPSFEEMKNALDLRSKSGVHKLLTSLEERGFIRKIPNKARALEILQLPDAMAPLASMHGTATTDEQVDNSSIVNVDFNNPGANIPVSTGRCPDYEKIPIDMMPVSFPVELVSAVAPITEYPPHASLRAWQN
jgi:repressor LexA